MGFRIYRLATGQKHECLTIAPVTWRHAQYHRKIIAHLAESGREAPHRAGRAIPSALP
jgi:hypothetical protein